MYSIETVDVGKYKNSIGQVTAITMGEREVMFAKLVNMITQRGGDDNYSNEGLKREMEYEFAMDDGE